MNKIETTRITRSNTPINTISFVDLRNFEDKKGIAC